LSALPALAFDHRHVVRSALRHLAARDDLAGKDRLREQLLEAAQGLEG
jgi:hypothetical protein